MISGYSAQTRTCGDIPDQQGSICGEAETVSGASVQDRVPGDLQCKLGLEVLVGHTVGALWPPIA